MVNMQSQQGDAVYAMKAHEAVTLHVRRQDAPASGPAGRAAPLLLATRFPWEVEPAEQDTR
jgi:hypothetical protein